MRATSPVVGRAENQPIELEEVLGPPEQRYFSAGYRHVSHHLSRVGFEASSTSRTLASGAAHYPLQWSVRADGMHRTPHLSSVDAIVLPILALEAVTPPDDLFRLSASYVASVELRSGAAPWVDLNDVPIEIQLLHDRDDLTLVCTVGNIRARVTLRSTAATPSQRDLRPHAGSSTVFGGRFQTNSARTASAEFARAENVLRGSHEILVDTHQSPAPGVGADFWLAPNVIDYLVMMGQLTQGVVYSAGDTDRAHIGPLWMRSMQIALDAPTIGAITRFSTSTRLVRDRTVERGDRRVHDVLVESEATTGVAARSLLAYSDAPA